MRMVSVLSKPGKTVKSSFHICPTPPALLSPPPALLSPDVQGATDHHPTWGGVPSHLSFPSSPSPIKTVILESDLTDYFLPLRESSITKGGGGGGGGQGVTDKTLALRSEFSYASNAGISLSEAGRGTGGQGRYFLGR